jgi:hypothetical protein
MRDTEDTTAKALGFVKSMGSSVIINLTNVEVDDDAK